MYTVLITDDQGCTLEDSLALIEPLAPLSISFVVDSSDCFGSLDGAIDATVQGGTSPYIYSWSNAEVSEDISGLGAGLYSLEVTDDAGCQLIEDTTVFEPSAMSISSIDTDILCFGDSTGVIDITVSGGTLPYSYVWNTGDTNEDLDTIPAGSYDVLVTDFNGCSMPYATSLSEPLTPLSLSITHTDALCIGGQEGTTDLTAGGGTAPYSYFWNNNEVTEDLTGLVAGYYYCQVTDDNGCTDTIGAVVEDPTNTMVPSVTHTDVSCFDGNDGTIDLTITGGLAPYDFDWSNGSSDEDLTGLATGNYFVMIMDANMCESFISAFVDQPDAPLLSTAQTVDILCFGDTTGSIDVTTTGGTVPYSFSWNTGELSEDLSDLGAGSYSLTITDDNACQYVLDTVLFEPTDLLLTATQVNVGCYGDSTGSIDLSVSGGVGPYVYSWSNGSIAEDIDSLHAGSYWVVVLDSNNCVDSLEVIITEPLAPLSVSGDSEDILCYGGNNGSIDITIEGGTQPYDINWSNAALTEDQTNLFFGTYQVDITDDNGCTASDSYTLTQPDTSLYSQIDMQEPLCFGDSNGSAWVVVDGGTPGYSYEWSSGEITDSISGIVSGEYVVEITDSNNCVLFDTIVVTEPTLLSVNADSMWVSCWGFSDGGVQSLAQGGVGQYLYVWDTEDSTQTVLGLPAGVYTVVVTDTNNCQAVDSTEILQPDSLHATFVLTDVLCNGFSTGEIDATVIGGTAPYIYYCPSILPSEDLTGLPAGIYNYSIEDSNACVNSYVLEITEPSAVGVTAEMTAVNCFGGSDGALDITVTGGVAPYSFEWENGELTEDIDSLIAGSYWVEVTDSNNCVDTFTFVVTEPIQALTLSLTQVNVYCHGDSTGSIDLSVVGGTAPYEYLWNTMETTEDIQDLDTGFYQVVVIDTNNCVDSISTIITEPPVPISITEEHQDILCFGAATGSIDITVTGGTPSVLNGYVYNWSNTETTEDISNIVSDTYTVIVTDSLLCVDSLEITLTQPDAPLDIDFIVEDVKCYGDSTGSVEASITGGTPPYEYWWSLGDSTFVVDSLPANTYEFFVLDSNNCAYSEQVVVSEPSAPLTATYVEVQPQCFGYGDGQLLLSPTGGTPGYTYVWSTGDTTQNLDSLYTGDYSVTITDTNNCVFDLDCFLGEPAQLQPSFDANILEGCTPLEVIFTNTSDADFDCEWEFGDGGTFDDCEDVEYIYTTEGEYDVHLTVYDANGCFNDVTYENFITVYQTPEASISADPTILFPDSPTTQVLNTSSYGDYYLWEMGDGSGDFLTFEPGYYTYPINLADTFMITLYASIEEGCADTAYQQILFNNDPFFYAPNTFIPDNDGRNDIWNVVYSNPEYLRDYRVRIFNRWGQLIFESTDNATGWDGTYRGIPCQDGTYTWTLLFTWYDLKSYDFTGHINLLK